MPLLLLQLLRSLRPLQWVLVVLASYPAAYLCRYYRAIHTWACHREHSTTRRQLLLPRRLARGPAYALRAAKEAVDAGLETDLDSGLAVERALFAGLFATADREIGMRSFIEHGPGKAEFR